jgi:hypothetical protein
MEQKSTDEQTFEQYRESLKGEATRLACYIRVYRLLQERRADRLDELNIAPVFFSTVIDALFSAIILWVDKIFDKHSQRGLHHFLNWVEQHQPIFSVDALKRRRALPDGHWLLEQTQSINHKIVEKDRSAITDFQPLKSFKIRRNKFHAHFDKSYFDDRKKIAKEAPLKLFDLDATLELFKDILNRYSAAYDGGVFHIEPLNVNDLNHLLDRLRHAKSKGDN